jgi:CheY-like chemotaxis protein
VKKILLADDSITIQKVVELTFSEGDYQVVCVGNGAQALKKLTEARPDVVLLDVIMPEKNGYEVCEQIKRNPSTSGIPVLLLTGTFEPFDRKRADQAGANGHLTKPFESQALVSKVEELIAATPSLASRESGPMEIISGGEMYRVDPGRVGEGLRPVVPGAGVPADSAPRVDTSPSYMPGSRTADQAAPAFPQLTGQPSGPGGPASATAPDTGGSYVGFADVGFGSGESEIVPDRFDEARGRSPSTLRLRRDEIPPQNREDPAPPDETGEAGPQARAGQEAGGFETPPPGSFSGEFESRFDLQDQATGEALTVGSGDQEAPEWTPPPEAPPASTWQTQDPQTGARPEPSEAVDGSPLALTAEAIDLIAEKVVQRMSDRVVREIAWEVIPEVVEAIVRRRIKELEDKPAE